MSHTFSDEAKAFNGGEITERIPFGVTKVQLVGVTANEAADPSKSDFLEVTVTSEDGIEDNVRVYFSEKAEKYSFATLKSIVVHNAKTDSDKEKARMAVENCKDLDELADLLNSKCVGAECWITKYFDPNRNYMNGQGQSRRSINTNLYGYEPKVNQQLLDLQQLGSDTIHPLGGEDVTGKVEIPGDGDW